LVSRTDQGDPADTEESDMSMNEQVLRSELSYRVEQGRGRNSSWSRVEGRTEPVVVRRGWRKVRTVIGR
jgi:hypothetical protein